MYEVNFACLFFGYLNRNSHAHEHFTCTGTLPVPVHRYRGILRSLFVHLFSVPTWASFCRSTSSCCSLLESILCKLCRWALLLSLPIRNLKINTLYSKMITRQVYMLHCTCTVNSVKTIWFLWAQVGWLKNRSTVSVLQTCRCMKRPVSLVYSCTSIILSRP